MGAAGSSVPTGFTEVGTFYAMTVEPCVGGFKARGPCGLVIMMLMKKGKNGLSLIVGKSPSWMFACNGFKSNKDECRGGGAPGSGGFPPMAHKECGP